MTGEQLFFNWPTRVALGRDDFFVTDANASAYAMVSAPDSWPSGKLALIGPKASGKTHLARVFAQMTGAVILSAADLTDTTDTPRAGHVVVEDLQDLRPEGEEALFHLHNNLAGQGYLLLTATIAPSRWSIALPDLASRMQGTAVARISDPDDQLLAAVIMKLFEDRQIAPTPGLVAYLSSRIERSFYAAQDIVARLDAEALSSGRKVNERLARALLEKD